MDRVRPKITQRPTRSGSNCTAESAEEQYRKEQELLAAKSRRLQQAEERLLNSLYPTRELIQEKQHEILQTQELHMAARQQALQREAELEQAISQKAWQQSSQQPTGVAPWTTTTLAYASAQDEHEARKQFAAQVAAENLALMAERAAQRQQQMRQQQEQDRQTITNETQFWNLGSTNSRWIAPEYRHLASPRSKVSSTATTPTAASAASAAPAAAVTPPWALHTSAEDSNLSRSSSLGGSNQFYSNSSSSRPHTAGGFEHHSERKHVQYIMPTSATSRKYPWEWQK